MSDSHATLTSSRIYRCENFYRYNEQGVALIVVLLLLVLIMLAGVIAVHQSKTDLRTATADQINTVLLHASDSANEKLETTVNGNTNAQAYQDIFSYAGVFGHYIQDPDAVFGEYIFCVKPNQRIYLKNNATIRRQNGLLDNLNKGICDYNSPNSYTSARQTVMTQVNIQPTPYNPADEAFSQYRLGKDITENTNIKHTFDIRATALLPAYSEPSDCLTKNSISLTATSSTSPILGCLRDQNTPSKMLHERVNLEETAIITMCTPFGSGHLDTCVLVTNP